MIAMSLSTWIYYTSEGIKAVSDSPFQHSPGLNIISDHEAGPELQRQSRSQFVGLRGTLHGPVLQRTVPPSLLPNLHACIGAQRPSGRKIRGVRRYGGMGLKLIVRCPGELRYHFLKKDDKEWLITIARRAIAIFIYFVLSLEILFRRGESLVLERLLPVFVFLHMVAWSVHAPSRVVGFALLCTCIVRHSSRAHLSPNV